MKNDFNTYLVTYGKTFRYVIPALPTLSSLMGIFVESHSSIAGYAFPPVGGSRQIAGCLCLLAILVAVLIGSTFAKTRHTTALTIIFGVLSLASLATYLVAWQRMVITRPVPSDGSSRSIVIGSVRTTLANPKLNDQQLVRTEGDEDDRIYLYYTKNSTDRRRIEICLIYGALCMFTTLCMSSIVAGQMRDKAPGQGGRQRIRADRAGNPAA